jgi:hypothetical protein
VNSAQAEGREKFSNPVQNPACAGMKPDAGTTTMPDRAYSGLISASYFTAMG